MGEQRGGVAVSRPAVRARASHLPPPTVPRCAPLSDPERTQALLDFLKTAHLLDVVLVCEHHAEAVDAQAPAPGGGQPVLQGGAEVVVHKHCLVIALSLGLQGGGERRRRGGGMRGRGGV